LSDGALIINCSRSDGVRRQGVGLVLSKSRVPQSSLSYIPVSERVMSVRLHTKHLNISVAIGYAPMLRRIRKTTTIFQEKQDTISADKDAFYISLKEFLTRLLGRMYFFWVDILIDITPTYHKRLKSQNFHESCVVSM